MNEASTEYRRFTTARLYERKKQLLQMRWAVNAERVDAELKAVRAEVEWRKKQHDLATVEAELKKQRRKC